MTIAMSGMMRLGGDINNIEKAFEGVGGCTSFTAARGKGRELSKGNNCGNAVLFEIQKFLKEIEKDGAPRLQPTTTNTMSTLEMYVKPEPAGSTCPECGEPIDHEGGCTICRACGYSHCA
jgi:ribonucleoside-diphosphate reductase alpha chain